jgi:hypothetical protein
MEVCANCGYHLSPTDPSGESQIYSQDVDYILCDPCWHMEDSFIESQGHNESPERLKHYSDTLKGAQT